MVEQDSAQPNRRRRTRLPRLAFGCLVALGLLIPAAASAQTFSPTGSERTYTVPAGATEIHVVAVGGSGYGPSSTGGEGAVVTAELPVTAGTQLLVEVGGNGTQCYFGCPPPAFNGGGDGSGGGASDLRTISCGATCPGTDASLASRLLVAGGGGAAGIGEAGGNAGADGSGGDSAGDAGAQTRGGRGGTVTSTGSCTSSNGADGSAGQGGGGYGGGGGGYFGGGGGATGYAGYLGFCAVSVAGGGGGGSNFVESGAQDTSYGVDSSATPSVTITVQPVANSAPSISGIAVQRQVLSEAHGTWAGGVTGYAYEWQRCDAGGAGCVAIPRATNQTYALANADVGSTIRVQETATTPDGGSAMTTSPASNVVQPLTPAPAPTIGGAAVQAQALTETHGAWPASPAAFGYQWERCDSGGGSCVSIGGAINQSYALTAADVGSTIRVLENVAYTDGNTATAGSAPTSVVRPVAPPQAAIVGPANALVGTTQTYRASVTDSQGVPSSYKWTVDGRVVGSRLTLSYAFTRPGKQLILLQITDTAGDTLAATQSVRVTYPQLNIRLSWNAGNSIPPRYSTFTSLVAHHVPAGVHIELTCAVGGCPFAHRGLTVAATARCHGKSCKGAKHHAPPGSRDVDLTSLVAGDRLPIGTTVTIRFTKQGFVGQVQLLTIQAGGPSRRTECLAPGSSKPGKGC
ncbi:MAG TPA: glycine-rich protein [Solirubrobacteraceae bacterium]